MEYSFDTPSTVLFGAGARFRLSEELKRLGAASVLLVTDHHLVKTGVIDAFQYFSQAYVVGRLATANSLGAPQDSTLFYALLLYDKLVNKFQIGQASAMAWILFVIILACTLIILRSSRRWAYYEDAT